MQKHYYSCWKIVLVCALFSFVLTKTIEANHGPGSGGGPVSTLPALTPRAGSFSLSFNSSMTELESISTRRLSDQGLKAGAFDAIDRTILHTTSAFYGVTDDFTLELSIGWFESINFRESHGEDGHGGGGHEEEEHEEGEEEEEEHEEVGEMVELLKANPDGLTDTWLTGKYRFFRGPQGHYAFILGVKFPTGRTSTQNNEGEQLEAVEQPGSGSFDFAAGIAYSRWLSKDWMLHSSLKYTLKTKGSRDYEIGDRIDMGVSSSYQLTPKNKFPNFATNGDLSLRQLFRDKQDSTDLRNSGSTTVFVSPGFNMGITKNFGINASISVPIYQKMLGRQQETKYQASVGIDFHF